MNAQKRDLIVAQRLAWGDSQQLCASCDRDAAPFSCYCRECEEGMARDELAELAEAEADGR